MAGDLLYENSDGSFIISYREALSHHMAASHLHSTYEIYYLLSGEREFFIQDRTIMISSGDLVIVAPNIVHRTTNADIPRHERIVVNMHERCLTAIASDQGALAPILEHDYVVYSHAQLRQAEVKSLLHQVVQEVRERRPGFELYAQTLMLQLLILCSRQHQASAITQSAALSPMHERMSHVARYINANYMKELTLRHVAETFYVSPYYLSRMFKEATGFSFVEYINHIRIKEAKKLLESSSMKASQIASKVGYGSVTHFGRVFKSITGYAPLHYRNHRN